MPPRKEPKETVVYPASKRKPPPFKPLRPSKVPRLPTSSSSSARTQPAAKNTAPKPARKATLPDNETDEGSEEEADEDEAAEGPSRSNGIDSSQSEELEDIPALSKFSTANGKSVSSRPFKPPPTKHNGPREPSPMSIASKSSSSPPPLPGDSSPPHAAAVTDPMDNTLPSQSDDIPSIPQPLLVRLLHEKFQDKSLQIDKHAIQVVQKYVEIFVREAIVRTTLVKRKEAEAGAVSDLEGKWLELEDLEKVAPALMMDF